MITLLISLLLSSPSTNQIPLKYKQIYAQLTEDNRIPLLLHLQLERRLGNNWILEDVVTDVTIAST